MRPDSNKKPGIASHSEKGPLSTKTKRCRNAHVLNSAQVRRRPRQERARFTAAVILRAALETIDEVGWALTSTYLIAKRAGVSIGSLYQYFDSKETILANLIEQHQVIMYDVFRSAIARFDSRQSIEELIRGIFRELVRIHKEDPVFTRVVIRESFQHRGWQIHEANGKSQEFIELLKRLIEQSPQMRGRPSVAVAHILVTVCEALTCWIVCNAPPFLPSDVLIDEMALMFSGYLSGRQSGEQLKGEGYDVKLNSHTDSIALLSD